MSVFAFLDKPGDHGTYPSPLNSTPTSVGIGHIDNITRTVHVRVDTSLRLREHCSRALISAETVVAWSYLLRDSTLHHKTIHWREDERRSAGQRYK